MTGAGTITSLLHDVAPGFLMCGGTAAAASAEAMRAGAVDTARTVRGAVRAVREQREFDQEFRRITRADPDLRCLARGRRRGGAGWVAVACLVVAWLLLPLAIPGYLIAMGYAAWLRAAGVAARRRRGGRR